MQSSAPHSLAGVRVLIARVGIGGRGFSDDLERAGASVVNFAVCRIQAPPDIGSLDSAVQDLAEFDWLVLTSANAASAVVDRMLRRSLPPATNRPRNIAAVGKATARALAPLGWASDLIPAVESGQGLRAALIQRLRSPDDKKQSLRVLLLQSAIADPELARNLAAAGHDVTSVVAYETVPDASQAAAAAGRIEHGAVDAVLFTSPSAVRAVAGRVQGGTQWPLVVSLGERTNLECAQQGLERRLVADHPTPECVRVALESSLSSRVEP